MIRMFLENRVLVLLFLPFIVGIYFLLNFQTGYYVQSPVHNFGLWSNFFSGDSWIYSFLSFIIITLNAISLNWVCINLKLKKVIQIYSIFIKVV